MKDGTSRLYQDRIGQLVNIRLRGDGLYGDLKYNPKHALAEQLLYDAEHAPDNVGLSHDVVGRTSRKGGKLIVESIEKVRCVDLVAEPATTAGLYESVNDNSESSVSSIFPRKPTPSKIRAFVQSLKQ